MNGWLILPWPISSVLVAERAEQRWVLGYFALPAKPRRNASIRAGAPGWQPADLFTHQANAVPVYQHDQLNAVFRRCLIY